MSTLKPRKTLYKTYIENELVKIVGESEYTVVEEYYDQIKDQYPDLTKEEIFSIVYSMFEFVRDMMKNESLPEIRIKYLGLFTVRKSRVLTRMKDLDRKLERGHIGKEFYNKEMNISINKIKSIEDETRTH